jgi:hypothetical protein
MAFLLSLRQEETAWSSTNNRSKIDFELHSEAADLRHMTQIKLLWDIMSV